MPEWCGEGEGNLRKLNFRVFFRTAQLQRQVVEPEMALKQASTSGYSLSGLPSHTQFPLRWKMSSHVERKEIETFLLGDSNFVYPKFVFCQALRGLSMPAVFPNPAKLCCGLESLTNAWNKYSTQLAYFLFKYTTYYLCSSFRVIPCGRLGVIERQTNKYPNSKTFVYILNIKQQDN